MASHPTNKDYVMSHHYSGPQFGFPNGDARLDFCDLYAFAKPGDTSKSILIMNVHPSSSLDVDLSRSNSMRTTTSYPFAPDAIYEIKIDTDGDCVADTTYRVVFSALVEGKQTASLWMVQGSSNTPGGGVLLVDEAPVSMDRSETVTHGGGHRFFAGWRSDPFFFDPIGAFNGFQFGKDFFGDKDVCSIVLEVPNSVFGPGSAGLWARTITRKSGRLVQVDRGALAAQSVFLTGDDRDAYLGAEPTSDDGFLATFAHSLEHTGGYKPHEAMRVAKTLLPDILPYDHRIATSYPRNGRSLTDDAMASFLAVITNGKVTSHGLKPHDDLLSYFPYVGPPHLAFESRPSN
jgi:hypothetical protein